MGILRTISAKMDRSCAEAANAYKPLINRVLHGLDLFPDPSVRGGCPSRQFPPPTKKAATWTAFRGEYRSRTGDLLHAMQAL